ncbi:hypothetical protein ACOSP7_009359 [Xanthoceras sorbifolium]
MQDLMIDLEVDNRNIISKNRDLNSIHGKGISDIPNTEDVVPEMESMESIMEDSFVEIINSSSRDMGDQVGEVGIARNKVMLCDEGLGLRGEPIVRVVDGSGLRKSKWK